MAIFCQPDNSSRMLKCARTKTLASIAIVAVLASGMALADTAQIPPPANVNLTTTYTNSGYADLVAVVKPAVANVRVERTATIEEMGGPQISNMDPELRRFFERFFGGLG